MAISRVQSANATSAGSSTSLGLTFSSAPTNGNFLVIAIATNGAATGQVTSISQVGATWSKAKDAASASSTIDIWYALSVSGAAATLTVNFGASRTSSAIVAEYSGVASSSALDVTASNTGSYPGSADSGTTATTAQADELWFAGMSDTLFPSSNWNAPTNSFTEIVESNNILLNCVAEEKIVSATGTANTSASRASSPGSGNWVGAIATFKAGTSAARRVFVIT